MVRLASLVRDIVEGVLGLVRPGVPALLIVLLGWFLFETALTVGDSRDFRPLALLVWGPFGALLLVVAVGFYAAFDAWDKDQPLSPDPPRTVPLFFLNIVPVVAIMILAEIRSPKVTFTYPLLRFYQFLFRRIWG